MAYRSRKHGKSRARRRTHAYSILQSDPSYCYLCARLYNDDSPQKTEEHHVFFGTRQRDKSEAEGLKVRLCTLHHRTGPEAVHRNADINRRLQIEAQKVWELSHSHAEWMTLMGRNYLEDESEATPTEELLASFAEQFPNLASHITRSKPLEEKDRVAIQMDNGRILIYNGRQRRFEIWRGKDDQGK